ncbi:MAG: OmpH family outer membrane protein [Candidatus Omnitrophota bacterium]
MRKMGLLLISMVFTLGIIASAQAADKFAYVDLSRVFAEYSKTKDYEKSLTEKESTYTAERDRKVNEVKALQDKINLLSEKEKADKKNEFESKVKSLQEFDSQKQMDLRKEYNEKTKEIFKDIEEAVKQYSEKEGFTMVFNDRVLVYQVKNLDITDKIVNILAKGAKK